MGFAGVALVAIVILLGGLVAPQWSKRKQAVVESREGDRFSDGVRIVNTAGTSVTNVSKQSHQTAKTTVSLLGSPRQIESTEGAGMDHAKTPRRPLRVRDGGALRMTPEQAQKLTRLKAARAARISRESAAAKRRLITVGVSLAVVIAFAGLAVAAIFPWWAMAVPSVFLVGTLVASRQAGIRTEKAHVREETLLRELEVSVRGGKVGGSAQLDGSTSSRSDRRPAEPTFKPAVEPTVEKVTPSRQERAEKPAEEPAESVSNTRIETSTFETEQGTGHQVTVVEKTDCAAPTPETTLTASESKPEPLKATGQTWMVADFPAPTHTRKASVTGRQVHADTDIKGVPQVETAPGRPVATSSQSETVDSETAAQSAVTFDLDAILDARRAQ